MRLYDLKTEYRENPLGIDAVRPRFSWKISDDRRNVSQYSWQIRAYSESRQKELIWDSGTVISDQSVAVRWEGPELKSRQRIYWNVTVCTVDGTGSREYADSETVWFEMGLLKQDDWLAEWIEPEETVEIDGRMPAPYLRKEFTVRSGLKTARIYQSAHGLYEFWINGKRGTIDRFKPGYTSYYKRLQYQSYDIAEFLEEGMNCLAVALGDGWWRGTTGGAYRNNFGYKVSYIGQILLEYEDGTREWILSDDSFKTSSGGLLTTDMKEGETFDARLEPTGWKEPGFDDSKWRYVHFETDELARKDTLTASSGVPVREKETFLPEVLKTPNGETVLNIGQNIAGYVKMRFHGLKRGQKITLVHGETLDKEGNFTQKNLVVEAKGARLQQIEYIACGGEEEEYQPEFSVSGFQYVLIKGLEGKICPEDFQAVAVYSDMEETGKFECSNPLLNRLTANSLWSQKGNFLDVPTDCPTRERNPWSGDSQIYARTSAKFMNVYPFFEKWLGDISLEQFPDGKIPITIPISTSFHNRAEFERRKAMIDAMPDDSIMKLVMRLTLASPDTGGLTDGSAGWGDTAEITPYMMYLSYGDRSILERQYPCAKKWVDYIIREAAKPSERYQEMPWYRCPEDAAFVWDRGFHFGEWLEPDDQDANFQKKLENPDYNTATMYYFYSAKLVSEMAEILGEKEDHKKYKEISEKVKSVFNKYFVLEDGSIKHGRQAPSVRALAFGLVDENKKKKVAAKLDEMIRENGYRLNTGFLSTPYLLQTLIDSGFKDTAFRLLEQTESPSWLCNVKAGATTILERWDGFKNREASFNHYSYGAVCSFLFEYVAGIRPLIETPGYKKFRIEPVIGGSLTYAEARYESGYGKIISRWQREEEKIRFQITIPVNTTAEIRIPADEAVFKAWEKQCVNSKYEDGIAVLHCGSGTWEFES